MFYKFFLFSFFFIFPVNANAEINSSNCEKSLANIQEPNVSCIVYLKLSEEEKNKIRIATSDIIHNLSCEAGINANKVNVVKTLSEPNIKLPIVLFKCDIKLNDGTTKVAVFDMAPEFTLQENRVIKASLNVGEISGIGFLGIIIKKQLLSSNVNEQLIDAANRSIDKLMK